jgi:hypothetical protein
MMHQIWLPIVEINSSTLRQSYSKILNVKHSRMLNCFEFFLLNSVVFKALHFFEYNNENA